MSTDPALKNIGKKVGLETWRINKFKLEPVPRDQHGVLFTGDSYIFLKTKSSSEWDVHFWLGEQTTSDEMGVAAIKTVEIDQALGGLPVQYREVQNHESSLFLSYFPEGVRYVEGGYDTGYNHVEDMFENWTPKLFHCKGKRNIRSTQVACKKESLNMGDVFILDLGRDIYVWMPPESGRLERIKGMSRARNIALSERHGNSTVHVLDEDWRSDAKFWSYFGGKQVIPKITKAKDDDEGFWKSANDKITLWKVSDASGQMKVSKIAQGDIPRSKLDSKDAFILDALRDGVYVWVGKECTLEERAKAMNWGQQYLEQQNLPSWTQVTRVLETVEPAMFIQWFGDWQDARKVKSFQPRLYQVSDESGKLVVEEVANYDQESLDGDDVMILDALNLIYVWVGAAATRSEREGAEKKAEAFLKQSKLPRHKKTTIETIFQGKETPTFKKFFPSWDDKLFRKSLRSVENMRKLLFK